MVYVFSQGETKKVPLGLGCSARIVDAQYTSPGSGPATKGHWSVSDPSPTGYVNVTFTGTEHSVNIQLTVSIDNVSKYPVQTRVV